MWDQTSNQMLRQKGCQLQIPSVGSMACVPVRHRGREHQWAQPGHLWPTVGTADGSPGGTSPLKTYEHGLHYTHINTAGGSPVGTSPLKTHEHRLHYTHINTYINKQSNFIPMRTLKSKRIFTSNRIFY